MAGRLEGARQQRLGPASANSIESHSPGVVVGSGEDVLDSWPCHQGAANYYSAPVRSAHPAQLPERTESACISLA